MYARRYGLIRTLAPLHVGASEGEESGNLNLIFRDPFTQTGIIPGSSIRGRFRADTRERKVERDTVDAWYGNSFGDKRKTASGEEKAFIKEGAVKFEYASLLWLPVFCPGQPVVWVSCPMLLKRYAAVVQVGLPESIPTPYTCSQGLRGRVGEDGVSLFFNLGFMDVKPVQGLETWIPQAATGTVLPDRLVVVDDADIGLIHDMALYRQSRVKLADNEKKVDGGAFFNVEALPSGSVLIFPISLKHDDSTAWDPFDGKDTQELYFGGLESVGFGRCAVTISAPSAQEAN
ncbi:MAG: RAMP superfamily CRISPR-associated protein [Cyanobium sp.]